MKSVYDIHDLMSLLKISRATFWRKRKAGVIPPPDINVGHPRWYQTTLEKSVTNWPTSPSA